MALNCVDRQKRLSYSTNAWKRDVITLIPRGLGLVKIELVAELSGEVTSQWILHLSLNLEQRNDCLLGRELNLKL